MNNNIFEILNMFMNSQNNLNNQNNQTNIISSYYPNDLNFNNSNDNFYQKNNTNFNNNSNFNNNLLGMLTPLISLLNKKNSSFNIFYILQNNNSNPISLISSILNQQKNSPLKKGESNSKCKIESNYEEL